VRATADVQMKVNGDKITRNTTLSGEALLDEQIEQTLLLQHVICYGEAITTRSSRSVFP
jgi:hypothetical protein